DRASDPDRNRGGEKTGERAAAAAAAGVREAAGGSAAAGRSDPDPGGDRTDHRHHSHRGDTAPGAAAAADESYGRRPRQELSDLRRLLPARLAAPRGTGRHGGRLVRRRERQAPGGLDDR